MRVVNVEREAAAAEGAFRGAARSQAANRGEAREAEFLRPAAAQEAMRRVSDALLSFSGDKRGVFAVTSATPGEGKTLIAVAVSVFAASSNEGRVLLIDGHLRKPGVHELLKVSGSPGLAECIRGERRIWETAQPVGPLYVLPAGEEANPSRLIRTGAARRFVEEVRHAFDVVIIDLPAISSGSDAPVMAGWCDRAILVVRAEWATSDTLEDAAEAVGRERLLGVVLNRERSVIPKWLERLL